MNETDVGGLLAIAGAMAKVDGGCAVFCAAVRLLAEGLPVGVERLASKMGWSIEKLEDLLATYPNVERDERGDIVGFALTLRPTAHVFEVDSRRLFTWCALDALFLPAILGRPARVTSVCAGTGVPVEMHVTPDGVDDLDPAGSVVSLVKACGPEENIRASFCNEVSFFASEQAASAWLRAHPGATVSPVAQAFGLGRDFVALMLGVSSSSCCSRSMR